MNAQFTGSRPHLVLAVALAGLALLGPMATGGDSPPAVAPTAAQLLPPGARVQSVSLEGGGFARALQVEVLDDGLRLRSETGWRTLPSIRAAGRVRSGRLWLGSDHQGRSVLARVVHGARTSLLVAMLATLVAVLLGSIVGLATASVPRFASAVIEVTTDGVLGLPRLLLLLILGLLLRGSVPGIGLAIGLGSWIELSRLVAAESRRLRGFAFLEAARTSGATPWRLAWKHLSPNLVPIVAVTAPLIAAEAIVLESTLAFLGVGGGPVSSSWGSLVADGQRLLPSAWWMSVFPGLLLCATAFAVHGLVRRRDPGPLSSIDVAERY